MRFRYRHWLIVVLTVIFALNGADRLALGLVLQSIKLDLHLSDTELGLVTGIAFALFYAIMGLPIARWADRGNRVHIVSLAAAMWGLMVALTGRVTGFAELLLVRMGVGIGDAGSLPMAQSLIPDYFTRAERPRATAVYMISWPASVVLGYFVAGWLNELYGWRMMFFWLGLPGLALAGLTLSTLREPRLERRVKGSVDGDISTFCFGSRRTSESGDHPTIKAVAVTLLTNATFRHLLVCYAVNSLFTVGIFQWLPAFFMRSYGLTTAEVGTWFTMTLGIGSLFSTYVGGAIASRYAANNERLQFKVLAATYIALGVDYALVFIAPSRYLAIALLGISTLANAGSGPALAALQTLLPPRMRAISVAIVVGLSANLVGAGLGPLAAGVLSDALRPIFGEQSLRYALLALCPGFAWSAWHMWRASRTVAADLEASRKKNDGGDTALDGPEELAGR